jgi:hypothetical protein
MIQRDRDIGFFSVWGRNLTCFFSVSDPAVTEQDRRDHEKATEHENDC